MSSKILDLLGKKLKESQVILDIISISSIIKAEKKAEQLLAICSLTLHFIEHSHLKKSVRIETIKLLTLSTFSNEIIFHCIEEDIWIESYQNVKIIKNLLKIREKVLKEDAALPICIEREKSLQSFIAEQSKLKRFWQGVFGKKSPQEQEKLPQRKSFCTLQIKDKDFVMQIAKTIYKCNYKNADLLYISGSNGFIFNQFEYQREQINESAFLFRHKETKENVMMRRILKMGEESQKLRRYLQHYKLEDYNQQILFAVETVKYYQIITPFQKEQKTLEELLVEENCISQIDLLSIFYKLMSFIVNNFNVVHSLSPKEIIVSENIIISSIFCINRGQVNVAYLAPEEIDERLSEKMDVETINLWKIGMLLYESAFLALPFSIEYLASVVASGKKLELKFPANSRSLAFKEFLSSILVINPEKRACPGWQKKIFNHRWILQSMK